MADKSNENEKHQNKQEKTKEKKKVDTNLAKSEDININNKKEEEKKTSEDQKEEDKIEKPKEEQVEQQPAQKQKEEVKKHEKKPEKTDKQKPEKKEKDDDFQYIVRLSNTDVNGEKNLVYGLTTIKGIGINIATLIADETGINRETKIGKLSEKQIEKIQNKIDSIQNLAPDWMLNHRKDIETGEDIHLTGSDIDMRLREEINTMKKIRSYKGIRHERGLVVRGQRTKGNNRKGLSLGVSKKAVQKK